jgi:hypothetical protein
MPDVKPGDVITVKGTVKEVNSGGVLVEFFSKTDQYEAWIREDKVVGVLVDAEDADEPEVDEFIEVRSPDGMTSVWQHDQDGWRPVNIPGGEPITWRQLKAACESWTRLYRDGEI